MQLTKDDKIYDFLNDLGVEVEDKIEMEHLPQDQGEFYEDQGRYKKGGSRVWEFFTKIEGIDPHINCNFCPKRYAYKCGTSSLTRHLRTVHPKETDWDFKPIERNSSANHSRTVSTSVCGSQMKVTKNSIWNHYSQQFQNGKLFKKKCNYCETSYFPNTSTTPLRHHLMKKHPEVLDPVLLTSMQATDFNKRKAEIRDSDKYLDFSDDGKSCRFCGEFFFPDATELEVVDHLIYVHSIDTNPDQIELNEEEARTIIGNIVQSDQFTLEEKLNQLLMKFTYNLRVPELITDPFFVQFVHLLNADYKLPTQPCSPNSSFSGQPLKKVKYSPVWQHFTEETDDKGPKCIHCMKEYAKNPSTTTLARHLLKIHAIALVDVPFQEDEPLFSQGFMDEENRVKCEKSLKLLAEHLLDDVDV